MTQQRASAAARSRAPGAIHATAVAVGEAGILIRGASGAGKSKLALAILAEAQQRGLFARLICDDRVCLSLSSGRLLAHTHPAVAGMIEERGAGLLPMAHETSAVVRAVVDLLDPGADLPRMPEAAEKTTEIAGISLPRLMLTRDRPAGEAAQRILAFLGKA